MLSHLRGNFRAVQVVSSPSNGLCRRRDPFGKHWIFGKHLGFFGNLERAKGFEPSIPGKVVLGRALAPELRGGFPADPRVSRLPRTPNRNLPPYTQIYIFVVSMWLQHTRPKR